MKTEIIPVRAEKTMKDELQKLALESKRTLSDYIRLVLEKAITEHTKL